MRHGKLSLADRIKIGASALVIGAAGVLGCDSGSPSVPAQITAENDIVNVQEDSSDNSIPVLDNDSSLSGIVSLEGVTQPANGSAVINGDNAKYTPNGDFFGNDSFTYTVNDGSGNTAVGTVNVTVENVNDAPVMNPLDDVIVEAGNVGSVNASAIDADGDDVSFTYPAPFDANGNFTASVSDVGVSTGLVVNCSDGNGGNDSGSFGLVVCSAKEDLDNREDYVIVTNQALSGYWNNFVNRLKEVRGFGVKVAAVEDIDSDYSGFGADLQDRIKKFLEDEKGLHPELTYVLLGGDVSVVPSRDIPSTCSLGSDNIPTDSWFADFDNDLYHELFVGRAPVESEQEIINFGNKTKNYERCNFDLGYVKNKGVLFLAEKMDASTDSAIEKDSINVGIFDFIENDFTLKRLYETLYKGADLEDKTSVMNALNEGWHFVNVYGHGGEDILQVGANFDDNIHSRDGAPAERDIRNLTNISVNNRPLLVYSLGCHSNAFDYEDCIGEHFVLNPNGGGPVFIGTSRIGIYAPGNPGAGTSWHYDEEFVNSVYNKNIREVGKTLADSKEVYSEAAKVNDDRMWVWRGLNLLGCPALKIKTQNPKTFTINKIQEANYLEVIVKDGITPIENALVSFEHGFKTYKALTNADGRAIYEITELPLTYTVNTDNNEDFVVYSEVVN